MGSTSPELLLRTGHSSQVVTLTFTGDAATNSTSDFASICSCVPTTLTLSDSRYGSVTLTYNPLIQAWQGCQTVSYPGRGGCGACTTAVWYTLFGNNLSTTWELALSWHQVSLPSGCPSSGTTCSSSPNSGYFPVYATITCSGTVTWSWTPPTYAPWAGATTFTVTF